MKLLLVVATLALAVSAETVDNLQWTLFKNTHNKKYEDIENTLRFSIFQNNLRRIEEHNARYEKGETSYFLKVTQFADWTKEEFNNMLKAGVTERPSMENIKTFKADPDSDIPEKFDWRDKGAVLEVKNQGDCGSCWAFSSTGALEGQLIIKRNQSISLSEQELIECSYWTGNGGCSGGNMKSAFDYVSLNGLSSEEQYPYAGINGDCHWEAKDKPLTNLTDTVFLDTEEESLAGGIAQVGPISVGLTANQDWSLYGGGIFDHPECDDTLNHGVLAVGYTADYWIIKNSWGETWGEKGYIRLVRGKNQCGLGIYMCYPEL